MLTENHKISVIIPVYNAEAHIDKCLKSLLPHKDIIEIICVNDASTDKTHDILETYRNKYNIKVFLSKENSGPAHCRNIGLKAASGEYVWFIDADDWVQPDAISNIQLLIKQSYADIIGFRAQAYNNTTQKIYLDNFRDLSVIPESFFLNIFNFQQGKGFLFLLPLELWSRVFKKDFLIKNNLELDVEIWGLDDGIFITECFIQASSIYYSKDILYTYRTHNSQSIIARLGRPNFQTYNIPILYAQKCNDIIKKHKLSLFECKTLIYRNIDRIIHMYSKLNLSLEPLFFKDFKHYLQINNLTKCSFIKSSPCYNTLKDFEATNYWHYFFKNFLYQVIESNTLRRVLILRTTVYKRQRTHNLIKGRSILSIFKTMTYIYKDYNEIHYIFIGFTLYKKQTASKHYLNSKS